MEGIGKTYKHRGMDQVNNVDIGGQASRQPPLMIPALSEEDQQAHTHSHNHERFPERVAKRQPVEPTRQGIASLLRSCCPRSLHHRGKHQTSKDERSHESDQRPVPSHPGGEFEEPIATIRDQTKDVEANILGKIAYWRVERLKNPACRPPEAHHKAHETQREDKHSDCSIAWKCSTPGGCRHSMSAQRWSSTMTTLVITMRTRILKRPSPFRTCTWAGIGS